MMGLESSIMSWSAFWIRQKQSNFGESETGAALKVKSPCNLDDGKKKPRIHVQMTYQKIENLQRNKIIYGRHPQSSILESHMGAPKEIKGMLFLKDRNQLMSKRYQR